MASRLGFILVLFLAAAFSVRAADIPNPGMQMLETEHYAAAQAHFQAALQKDPQDAAATADMAKLYLSQGKTKSGVHWAEKAVALAPKDATYQILLGDAYGYYVNQVSLFSKLGVAHKILAAYQQAVRLEPRNAEAHYSLATYYIVAPGIVGGSDAQAHKQIAVLERLDAAKANDARATLALADKDTPKAEAYLRDAAKTDNTGDSDYVLGLLLMSQKHYTAAISAFENGISQAPSNSSNYYQVGHAAVLGKIHEQEGIQDLQKYLSLPHDWHPDTPTYTWAHYRLGMLYGITGSKANEKAQYQAALKLDPDFKEARKALAAM
jgi:tetratricopeptide (TPR) repeat protein